MKNSVKKAQEVIDGQPDGVLALKLSILLLPSIADRVQPENLPGYKTLLPKQKARIRALIADKENELIQNIK